MKLNHGISVLTKTRHILCCVSQLIFHCINHALWDGCVLWVLCFGCSHFFFLFTLLTLVCALPTVFIFMFILSLLCVFLPLLSGTQIWMHHAVVFYRNSVCVCFPSQALLLTPTSTVCTHACTAHRAALCIVTVKTLLVSKEWCHVTSVCRGSGHVSCSNHIYP